MKCKRTLSVIVLSLIMVLINLVPAVAYENLPLAEKYVSIDIQNLENNKATLTYILVEKEDGTMDVIDPVSVLDFDYGTQIYVGALTVKKWEGKNITFSIKIISSNRTMKSHYGVIEFYKAKTLGIGNLFNSMTFSLRYGAGTKTMADEYTMSAEGNTKIYIKLTNMYVEDSFGEILSLSNSTRLIKKSDYI
jgi:hypothetical protein